MANKNSSRRAQGTGSIYKKTVTSKDGKTREYWESQVTVGYDPGTGKQKRKTFTGKTQKEVREKMQAAAVAVQNGDYFEPSRITVGEWLDIWLKDYCTDTKYLTDEKYECVCRVHIKPALGAIKLSKLQAPQIQAFYNELGKTGKTLKSKDEKGKEIVKRVPMANKSIRLIHGVLSKALNTAVKLGFIKQNPAALCTIPKLTKKEIHPLTDTQVQALIKACDGEPYGNVYKLIVFTGLREGEALGLTWDCVDFNTGSLKINKQLQKQNGIEKLVPLKNSKPRYLTAAPFVMQLLKQQYNKQTEERLKAGEFWQGWKDLAERESALVFTKADGTPITAAALYQRYKHIAASIGIPDSRVHDLRHTFAVISLQNGDNVKTVQDNLGHATAAFTLDVYGHVSEKMKTDSAERMQQYIEKMA
jgi:integrase